MGETFLYFSIYQHRADCQYARVIHAVQFQLSNCWQEYAQNRSLPYSARNATVMGFVAQVDAAVAADTVENASSGD